MLVGKKTNSDGSITFTFLSEELHIRSGFQTEKPRVNPRPAPKNPSLNEKLYDAARKLNSKRVLELLEKGADPNYIHQENAYEGAKSVLRFALNSYNQHVHLLQRGELFYVIKALIDYGVKINSYIFQFSNHWDTGLAIFMRRPTNVLNLLLSSNNRFINQEKTEKIHLQSHLGEILDKPNYHKFQLLLCHGMALDGSTAQKYFQQFFQNCWPRPIQFYRKNQHKRKIIATTLMWRKLMILYCFVKRNLYAWDLSYLKNTSIKDFVSIEKGRYATVHFI
jgi:hypothetical protein